MATTTARRYIEVVVQADDAMRELRRLADTGERTEQRIGAMQRTIAGLGTAFKAFVGFEAARMFVDMADSATDLQAKLQGVQGSAEGASAIFNELKEVSNRTGTDVGDLASAYAKLAVSMPGVETEKLVQGLDLVTTSLATTGASTQQVSSVMLQLSQALASGVLQGDEFKAIAENNPVLLRAWAEAAGFAGTSMKQLSEEGKLTAKSFYDNLDAIEKLVYKMTGLEQPPLTVARAFNVLKNEVLAAFFEMSNSKGVFDPLARALLWVATDVVPALKVGFVGLVNTLSGIGTGFEDAARIAEESMGQIQSVMDNAQGSTDDWKKSLKEFVTVDLPTSAHQTAMEWQNMAEDIKALTSIAIDYVSMKFNEFANWIHGPLETITKAWDETWKWMSEDAVAWLKATWEQVQSWGAKIAAAWREFTRPQAPPETWALQPEGAFPTSNGRRPMPRNDQEAESRIQQLERELQGFAEFDAQVRLDAAGKAAEQRMKSVAEANAKYRKSLEETETKVVSLDRRNQSLAKTLDKTGDAAGKAGKGMREAAKGMSDTEKEATKVEKANREIAESFEKYKKGLEDQIALAQMADRDRAIHTAGLETEAKARELDAKAAEAQAAGMTKLAEAYRAGAQQFRDFTPEAKKLAGQLYDVQAAAKEAKDSLESIISESLKEAVRGIQQAFANLFLGFFTNGLKSWKAFWGNLKMIALQTIAQIAARTATVSFMGLFGFGASGAASATGAGAAAGQASMLSSLTSGISSLISFFSPGNFSLGTSIGGAIESALFNTGFQEIGSQFALGMSQLSNVTIGLTTAIGGLAGAWLAGKAFGTPGARMGGGIGGGLGATIGMATPLGPIGAAIGWLMGTALGGLLGKIFGKKKERPDVSLSLQEGQLSVTDFDDIKEEDRQRIQEQVIAPFNAVLNALTSTLPKKAREAVMAFEFSIKDLSLKNLGDTLESLMTQVIETTGPLYSKFYKEVFEKFKDDGPKLAEAFQLLGVSFATLEDFVTKDPLKEFVDGIKLGMRTIGEVIADLDAQIMAIAQAPAADLDADKIVELAALVQQRYDLEIKLLSQVADAVRNIKTAADSAREQILLTNASQEQIYNYRRNAADLAMAGLETATDPAQIMALSQKALENALAAWSALPPEEQARLQQDFLGFVDAVEQTANAQLEEAAKRAEESMDALRQQINALLSANDQRQILIDQGADTNLLLQELITLMRSPGYTL